MEELEFERKKINEIDKKIASLFEQRMSVSKRIALIKKNHSIPVFDEDREAQICKAEVEYIQNPEFKKYFLEFIHSLMDISKKFQSFVLQENGLEYALIGEKLSHSFSKEIYNKIGNYDYCIKEVQKQDLATFIKSKKYKGLNITIPYKSEVIPFLDCIDEDTKKIGAVNTIVNKEGKLYGYNTDFIGLKKLILSLRIELAGKKVLILGTGGTSHTARVVAQSLNAKQIVIVSRTFGRGVVTYEDVPLLHKDAQIIINTTPNGMFPNIESMPLSLGCFEKLEAVVDVIYNPIRSRLVLEAQKRGIKAQGGLYMLVQQAICASEYFFGKTIVQNQAEKIYKDILTNKQNIVLIGMPGCGKSSVGKKISESLCRTFYDMDQVITLQQGMSPAQIINQKGELYFREIEANVCRELSTKSNAVISTGGGTILLEQNVINLKYNGVLFFIDREIKKIFPTKNRPLSDSKEKLKEIYEQRYSIFKSSADFSIKSDNNISHTIEKILKVFEEKEI